MVLTEEEKKPANVEEGVWVHVEENGEKLVIRETVESRPVLL